MPQPNLLHPVPIIIQQLNKASTIQDDDFREPVQQALHNANKTAPGQVKWISEKDLEVSEAGTMEGADGYVLFRYVDLAARGITLQQNDRIIKMGTLDTDVYIVKLRPEGHYPDIGGPTLVKAFFKDRQPTKQGNFS